ncbi:MAG: hypothetical protein ABW106_16520 [Steroidobacteraceae bacterium]
MRGAEILELAAERTIGEYVRLRGVETSPVESDGAHAAKIGRGFVQCFVEQEARLEPAGVFEMEPGLAVDGLHEEIAVERRASGVGQKGLADGDEQPGDAAHAGATHSHSGS